MEEEARCAGIGERAFGFQKIRLRSRSRQRPQERKRVQWKGWIVEEMIKKARGTEKSRTEKGRREIDECKGKGRFAGKERKKYEERKRKRHEERDLGRRREEERRRKKDQRTEGGRSIKEERTAEGRERERAKEVKKGNARVSSVGSRDVGTWAQRKVTWRGGSAARRVHTYAPGRFSGLRQRRRTGGGADSRTHGATDRRTGQTDGGSPARGIEVRDSGDF